jgi:hypothetical protein
MKKSLLIIALTVFSFANAQKGTILVLGNVGYSSQKSDVSLGISPTQKSFNFSPKVGYQYNDNWTVGVESYISNSKQTYTSGEYKNFNLGSIGYSTLNYSNPANDTQNFNFRFGQAFNVGISKNF